MRLHVSFTDHLCNINNANEIVNEQTVNTLFNKFSRLAGDVHFSFPIFYVIDYTKQSYLCLTDSICLITQFDTQEFIEGGTERMVSIIQKEDFKIFNQKIFGSTASFLKKTAQTEHDKYIFSFNFRVQRKDKALSSVWQQCSYITSNETGLPLYNIGIVTDITAIKTDNTMVQYIERVDEKGKQKKLIERNIYYPNEEDTIITKKEKTVIAYISDGLSSKQIADKLKISENTIDNHRQNMLKKTNTKNVAELVAFVIKNRII